MIGVSTLPFARAFVFTASVLALSPTAEASLVWEQKEIKTTVASDDKAATATFKFANKGTKTVTIYTINPTCGCVAAGLKKKIYPPGEAGELTLTFKFGARSGPQSEGVTVRTDDTASDAELKFLVTIPRLFSITPQFLFWHEGDPLKPKQAIFKIEADAQAGQLSVTSSEPRIKVSATAITQGKEYKLTVTPDADISGLMVNSKIAIETQLSDGQKISTFLYAFAKH